jgi:hypothetical protein
VRQRCEVAGLDVHTLRLGSDSHLSPVPLISVLGERPS